MPSLSITSQGTCLYQIALKDISISIGRAGDNDICLNDSAVSAHHAKIISFFEPTFILDLRSTNGTFVNDKRIMKQELHNGDTITIGDHQLVYQAPEQPQWEQTDTTQVLQPSSWQTRLRQRDIQAPKLNIPLDMEWIAQDAEGNWWAFESRPAENESGWNLYSAGRKVKLGHSVPHRDWRATLIRIT